MWLKADDKMHAHRKTRKAISSHPEKRRDSAPFGLWLMAGTWTGQNNPTTGWVPEFELDSWDDDWPPLARRLVAAGYWWPEVVDGEPGFGFVNWSEWNPAADAAKSGSYGNHVRWHINRGVVDSACEHCPTEPDIAPDMPESSGRIAPDIAPDSGGESDGNRESSLYPTRTRPEPDPNPKEDSSPIADATPDTRPEIESLCRQLSDRMVANDWKKPIIGKTWLTEARLLLDVDKRDPEQARTLIDWCQDSTFWKPNIKSMAKFREKYDTLRLQAEERGDLRGAAAAINPSSVYSILDEHGQYREPPRPTEAMMARRPDPYQDLAG